jgi:hypothetical protein
MIGNLSHDLKSVFFSFSIKNLMLILIIFIGTAACGLCRWN